VLQENEGISKANVKRIDETVDAPNPFASFCGLCLGLGDEGDDY